MPGLAAAYTATAAAWQAGPGRIYDRLSESVVGCCPVPLRGRLVLDLGAGTGAASRAALAAGAAHVVAADAAFGMLAQDAAHRPAAAVGDAVALPFASGCFDAVVAAFSLNHLADPVAGFSEARRVTRQGGAVVAASYAADDTHPVKEAVEAALRARGWRPEPWYAAVKNEAMPKLATAAAVAVAASAAGLRADVVALRVPFPALGAADLAAWRLGMAQSAPFVAQLSAGDQADLMADAVARIGPQCPILERSVLIASAIVT